MEMNIGDDNDDDGGDEDEDNFGSENDSEEEEKENKKASTKASSAKRAASAKKTTAKAAAVNKSSTPVKRSALSKKFASIDKVRLPSTGPSSGAIRRVGLSRSAPTRPLSPVKILKFD